MTLDEFVEEHPVDHDRVEAHKAAMVEELDSPKPKRNKRRAHKGYANSRAARSRRGGTVPGRR